MTNYRSVFIPTDLYDALHEAANTAKVSMSELVTVMLIEVLRAANEVGEEKPIEDTVTDNASTPEEQSPQP